MQTGHSRTLFVRNIFFNFVQKAKVEVFFSAAIG